MNISDMLYSLYLFDGFKDDVLNAYLKKGVDVKSNKDFMNAVSLFNSNSKIKDDIKKQLGSISNIGYGVADRFSPTEFINLVNNANQKYAQLNQKGLLKSQARLTASSASDDYYIYPCRTFEEAHRAAFSHTGNLKRLSREDREKFFLDEYGIKIPEPETHFLTNMTPKQMLEFMKECPVFMEPTWCVCGGKKFWNDYKLEASKDKPANCFVVISKTHPNVRFCITRDSSSTKTIEGDYVIMKKELGEFRDIWQIGGGDVRKVGTKMAELAFGDISDILNNVLEKYEKWHLKN